MPELRIALSAAGSLCTLSCENSCCSAALLHWPRWMRRSLEAQCSRHWRSVQSGCVPTFWLGFPSRWARPISVSVPWYLRRTLIATMLSAGHVWARPAAAHGKGPGPTCGGQLPCGAASGTAGCADDGATLRPRSALARRTCRATCMHALLRSHAMQDHGVGRVGSLPKTRAWKGMPLRLLGIYLFFAQRPATRRDARQCRGDALPLA